MRRLILFSMLLLSGPVLLASGRRPEADDGFPDYNRLEMRKKQPDIPTDVPTPAPPPKPMPHPSLNVPVNASPSQDDVPKPPPPVVPSASSSEPALPDDMMNTLVPSATVQISTPPAK